MFTSSEDMLLPLDSDDIENLKQGVQIENMNCLEETHMITLYKLLGEAMLWKQNHNDI